MVGSNAYDPQNDTEHHQRDPHDDERGPQQDRLLRMKLHEAIVLFHDQRNKRQDPDGITEGGRKVSIQTKG